MRTRRVSALAVVGVLALLSASTVALAATRTIALPWVEDDYAKAVAQARAKNVPIFVEAWAPW